MINNASSPGIKGMEIPPSLVVVNPRKHRTWKNNNKKDFVDGRSSGAKTLLSRIQRRKMKEQVEETIISEAVPSETERAQKQIGQMKKLNRQKDLQKKKDDAKKKMINKTREMDTLMKARLSDFKKKATSQTQKLKKEEIEMTTNMILEYNDVLDAAVDVATKPTHSSETSYAKIQFADGGVQNLDQFSARKIAAAYAGLEGDNQHAFRYMLNKNASTYQSALDFAIRNV
jgi:molecular chaperone GrpE (heat shock protein)